MPAAATRADALRVVIDGETVESLHVIGTIPGVAPLAAAGIGGAGTGRLRSIGDGTWLQWRAPGNEEVWGEAVHVTADGEYLLEDGVSTDRWLRVNVATAFLGPPIETEVQLSEWYNNGLAGENVTAAQAAAGYTRTFWILVYNDGASDVLNFVASVPFSGALRIWPTDAKIGSGLGVATDIILAGDFFEFYAEVTTGPGAPAHAGILNQLNLSWFGA